MAKWELPNLAWVQVGEHGNPPPLPVGDALLVAVPLKSGANEYHVIVATECGFDDPEGCSWFARSWSDVSHYCLLHPASEESA